MSEQWDLDDQDLAESLDADVIDDDRPVDQDDAVAYPPDTLMGANEYGITAMEERVDEPLDERESRYEPDPLREELDRAEELRELWSEADGDDAVGPLAGSLMAPDDPDDDPVLEAEVASDAPMGPEELAIHIEPEPEL